MKKPSGVLYIAQVYGDSGDEHGAFNLQYQVGTEAYARRMCEGLAVINAKIVCVVHDEDKVVTGLSVTDVAISAEWFEPDWRSVKSVDLDCFEVDMTPPLDDQIFSLKVGKKIVYGPKPTLLDWFRKKFQWAGEQLGFTA